MLTKQIIKLTKSFFRPKFNPGFQTRIYPTLGESIVLHDTLDFGPLATADEIGRIAKFWQGEETLDTSLTAHCRRTQGLTFDSFCDRYSATDLPMMDSFMDTDMDVDVDVDVDGSSHEPR